MKQWICDGVLRFLRWWNPPPPPPPPPDPDVYRDAARPLMGEADQMHGTNGDAKRRQVYAALQKQFPAVRRRDLAYAIECVMQERP